MKKFRASLFCAALIAAALSVCWAPGCKKQDDEDEKTAAVGPPVFVVQEIDGSLDTNFNSKGYALSNAGFDDYGLDATVDAWNRIVAVGYRHTGADSTSETCMVIRRYKDNGEPDKSFNANGGVDATGKPYAGRAEFCERDDDALDPCAFPYHNITGARGKSVLIDGEGRIVVSGVVDMEYHFLGVYQGEEKEFVVERVAGAVWRYTAAGKPDESFNSDKYGMAIYSPAERSAANIDFADMILYEGDILIAGGVVHRVPTETVVENRKGRHCEAGGPARRCSEFTSASAPVVWRYSGESGELVFASDLNPPTQYFVEIATDANGMPSCDGAPCEPIERGVANAAALDPDGRILAAGNLRTAKSFSLSGEITLEFDEVRRWSPLVGSTLIGYKHRDPFGPFGALNGGGMAVWRFSADGTPDRGFGENERGRVKYVRKKYEPWQGWSYILEMCAGVEDIKKTESAAFTLTALGDGSVLAAGQVPDVFWRYCSKFYSENNKLRKRAAMVKYGPDGTPDVNFGENGVVYYMYNTEFRAIAADHKERILATILISGGGVTSSRALRYTSDGSIDASFDTFDLPPSTMRPTAESVVTDKRGMAVIVGHVGKNGANGKDMIIWRLK